MGKKGKGNKLAKMSEEERARYLQLRADIEEEARRRKQQLITLYMKNKLKREDAFCRLNMAKINQEWRSLLRQVKCQELRKELHEVEKFTKEALERKQQVIDRLLGELDGAENMYGTMHQSHMECMQKLIGIQQRRAEFFKQQFESQKKTLLEECRKDFDGFKVARGRGQEQLECVMFQLEDKASKEAEAKEERHLERMDDIKSTLQLRVEELTQKGEAKLENLWQEYQDMLSGYVQYTEGFYSEYVDLKERDEESTALIREHCRDIEKATDQLSHLKLVQAENLENDEVKVNYLLKVKTDLSERFSTLKLEVDQEMKAGEEKFKLMSVESHNALQNMREILKKGETLMQLATVCRKLETNHEKMQPCGLPPLIRQLFEQDQEEDTNKVPEALKDDEFGFFAQMENFWRRVNNVKVDVSCLKRKKKEMEAEHARLKVELQEYLVNLNISNGTNTHINEYLANRPNSMQVERVVPVELQQKKSQSASLRKRSTPNSRLRRPITSYVEANLTNAVRSRRLAKGKPKLPKIVALSHW